MVPFMIKPEVIGQANVATSAWESQHQPFECPLGVGNEIPLSSAQRSDTKAMSRTDYADL